MAVILELDEAEEVGDEDLFSEIVGRSMHFTLSLHIDNDNLARLTPKLFEKLSGRAKGAAANPDHATTPVKRKRQFDNQSAYPPERRVKRRARAPGEERHTDTVFLSRDLAEAMDPMFSDIADRERLGLIEDYVLAIPARERATSVAQALPVDLAFSSSIEWQTEGNRYRAVYGDESGDAVALERTRLPLRRFWYVHRNNCVSYHLSLRIPDYEHTPAYFFLFSVLQKLVSPKEFKLGDGILPDGKLRSIELGHTPALAPFQALHLRDSAIADRPAGEYLDFWQFVATHFEADLADLHQALTGTPVGTDGDEQPLAAWNSLLKHDPYVEVPGLAMPNVRCMFYFHDPVFQDLLLPRRADGNPALRLDMMREDFFEVDLERALKGKDMPSIIVERPDRTKVFGPAMWQWFADQHADPAAPDTEIGAIDPAWFLEADGAVAGRNPEFDEGGNLRGDVNLGLTYLFLAGFTQNIIDFVNQDSSEVLDSLDPVYPFASDDVAEGFFARYANPRSLITFVRRMRSLDAGDEYIGTCPYAFLIHVLTIHNEFLTRDFEQRAAMVLDEATRETAARNWTKAAETFYRFREQEVEEYDTFHYENIFRYDTEGKVFAELQRIRGIEIKHQYVVALIDAAERRTRDNEERQRRQEEEAKQRQNQAIEAQDRQLNILVIFVGFFSILQVTFAMGDGIYSGEIGWDFTTVSKGVGTIFGDLSFLTSLGLIAFVIWWLLRVWLPNRRRPR